MFCGARTPELLLTMHTRPSRGISPLPDRAHVSDLREHTFVFFVTRLQLFFVTIVTLVGVSTYHFFVLHLGAGRCADASP